MKTIEIISRGFNDVSDTSVDFSVDVWGAMFRHAMEVRVRKIELMIC